MQVIAAAVEYIAKHPLTDRALKVLDLLIVVQSLAL